MSLPSEFFATQLANAEFRIAVSLFHLSDSNGFLEATTEELAVLTGMSTESIRRALRGLESVGLLETTRTRRNYGKFSRNQYQLILPSLKNVGRVESPSHKNVGSTGGHVVPPSSMTISHTNNQVTEVDSSTYCFVRPSDALEERKVDMARWNPNEDEGIAGVGLFEEEVAAKVEPKKISKRDTNTRHLRPKEEWTTRDVAAEFSRRLSNRFPYAVNLVNRERIAGALSKYRTQNNTTALIELTIMDMFFEDPRNLRDAEQYPQKIHGWYLNMFKSHLNKALERLGMEKNYRVLESELTSEPQSAVAYIYASDGRSFEDTFLGRKQLKQYEERINV